MGKNLHFLVKNENLRDLEALFHFAKKVVSCWEMGKKGGQIYPRNGSLAIHRGIGVQATAKEAIEGQKPLMVPGLFDHFFEASILPANF